MEDQGESTDFSTSAFTLIMQQKWHFPHKRVSVVLRESANKRGKLCKSKISDLTDTQPNFVGHSYCSYNIE